MSAEKQGWIGEMVTRRATVMTSLLVLNTVVLFFATIVYFKSGAYFLFIAWTPLVIYTLIRHERWAKKAPWLLAPQKVAIQGMKLFGTSEKSLEDGVIDMEPINNPQLGQVEAPKKEKGSIK